MPYVKKGELENMLRGAFGQGYWDALAVDHYEDELHVYQEEKFKEFYESFITKQREIAKVGGRP